MNKKKVKFKKKLLPYFLRKYLKRIIITKQDRKIINNFKNSQIKNAILFSGFKKSGNTWARFIIFNYFNILINNANKSLNFDELNTIQSHYLEGGSAEPFKPGFPPFYRTHAAYKKVFDYFSKVIYIYRNPLDTIISLYFYEKNRTIPFKGYSQSVRKKLHDIDYFVLYNIHKWIYHYNSTINKSDVILCYERMKKNAYDEFFTAFNQLGFNLEEEVLKKSIIISSTENIKKMARVTNQLYGMADPKSFKSEFIRSGKTRQYLTELKPYTIKKVKQILFNSKINIDI